MLMSRRLLKDKQLSPTRSADEEKAAKIRALLLKLDLLLTPHINSTVPIAERNFLEAVKICHQLSGRYINFNRMPQAIQLHGIKEMARQLNLYSQGKKEGALLVCYDRKKQSFQKGEKFWGNHKSVTVQIPTGSDVEPSFIIHNHPDDLLTTQLSSMFSSEDFSTLLSNPYLQFLVMVTAGRIFLILKTTQTAEAFLHHDFKRVIASEEKRFRLKEKKMILEKKRQLTTDEFIDLASEFNESVCRILKLGFYATDIVPNKFNTNEPTILELYPV